MATLEQERAGFALEKVEKVKGDPGKANAKFKTQLLKLPARLHNNGLGQTTAFLLAQKHDSPERQVYGWLEEWLAKPERHLYHGAGRLIDGITGDSEGTYRRASVEARALSVWLKRFAEAFLAEDPE